MISDLYSRARSIKTRIETPPLPDYQQKGFIREQDPLKQGLKQKITLSLKLRNWDSRARSIKTRIETIVLWFHEGGHYLFASKIH
ncbi:conserved protein [Methanosarcina mazei Go1]|uniref:Conserved protein n=1 Tax=Methanosarcina mazei (strain ATCC BAA-159 / DSM 3647 / Goe1 / Go1 / JCM 11833 / OCM 88) TaxID=192952 RepID=Q8PZE0_METMA|nr:conserved protein [Methanosarcina mazei Go1]